MRSLSLPLLLILASGCTGLDPQLERAGAFIMGTNGLTIFDDGHTAHAAMLGSTCEITTSGRIGDDRSVSGRGAPDLLGGKSTDEGNVVLLRTHNRVHLMQAAIRHRGLGPMQETHTANLTVAQAALTDDGVVALTPGCEVQWLDPDLSLAGVLPIPAESCDHGSLAVEPTTGGAWVTVDGELLHTDGRALQLVDTGADEVVWSAQSDTLLVTDHVRGEIRALDPSGALRWSTTLDGPILQVADFPGAGVALVVSETPDPTDNRGILRFVDLQTGRIDRQAELPRAALVQPAPDGRTFALLRPNLTQFFRVR